MLDRVLIKKLFHSLNEELATRDVHGEIGICGGAVMCLVYQSREATKDIDGIFKPTKEMKRASRRVAAEFGLDDDWLNDAAKAYFHVDPPREPVLELSHLRVWAPSADYMLAMKCISARFDTHDQNDVRFLIDYLGLKKPKDVFAIICRYYPSNQISAKTKFLVEELLD